MMDDWIYAPDALQAAAYYIRYDDMKPISEKSARQDGTRPETSPLREE